MPLDVTSPRRRWGHAPLRYAGVGGIVASLVSGCGEPTNARSERAPLVSPDLTAQAEIWTYSVLGNLGNQGNVFFATSAINDGGQIAGLGRHPLGPIVAWRWKGGVFQTTLPLDSTWGGGYGINNHGDVFGKRSDDMHKWSNMIWHPGNFGNVEWSFANYTPGARVEGEDINDAGYAVGSECAPYGTQGYCTARAFLWKPTQVAYPWWPKVVALGPLGDRDEAFAINNVGTALGYTEIKGTSRAWINTLGGKMQALPLGPTYTDSWPGDVNDGNVTVGVARATPTGHYRFVKWVGTSRPIDLGVPQDADWSQNQRAHVRISNKGRVAGNAQGAPFTFMTGTTTPLPVPFGAHAEATGINTCGDIVGVVSYFDNGGNFLIRWQRLAHTLPACD